MATGGVRATTAIFPRGAGGAKHLRGRPGAGVEAREGGNRLLGYPAAAGNSWSKARTASACMLGSTWE